MQRVYRRECEDPLRASSAGPARVGGKLPVSARLVVSKHVHMSVIGVDFEPALRRCKPAIDDVTHSKAALAEPESERLLLAAIAGVALHANRHGLGPVVDGWWWYGYGRACLEMPAMTTAHASLTLQLLEWIAEKPRTYAELMEAWKTSCPRLSIWEDACADGLVGAGLDRESAVYLTDKGRRCLQARVVAG